MDSTRYLTNKHRSALRLKSTKHLENLQRVIDAAKTASQSLELRKRFIQKQNRMNYRNEYDRLFGELNHLAPELRKAEIQNMMEQSKLKEIGEYIEPVVPAPAPAPRGRPRGSGVRRLRTPGVRVQHIPSDADMEDNENVQRRRTRNPLGRPRNAI